MSEIRKLKITEMNRLTVEEFKEADKLPLVVVLDEVRSLHNIGAVFRTSDAFWKYCQNTQDAVNELHEAGYTVLSIEQCEGSTMLGDMVLDKDKKYAIVMGNELKGVKQEIVDMCDGCIEIPQYGTKHSLNVSVTAGIVLWEFANKFMEFRKR